MVEPEALVVEVAASKIMVQVITKHGAQHANACRGGDKVYNLLTAPVTEAYAVTFGP